MGPPEEEGPPAELAGQFPGRVPNADELPPEFPPKTWFQNQEPEVVEGGQGVQLQHPGATKDELKAQKAEDVFQDRKAEGKLTHEEQLGDIAQQQAKAYADIAAADKAENAYNQAEGVRIAKEAEEKQAAADQALETAHTEATRKRQELDIEAVKIANTKTDPNRAIANMSLGKKIALIIAAGLQGYRNGAMGKAGAQNNIMDFLNGMIDQDLKAQQMDIANRTTMLGTRGALNTQQWGAEMDMHTMRYKSVATHYEMAKNQMQATALQFNNPRIDAKLALNHAELDKWKLGEQDTYEAAMRKASLERQQFAEEKRVNQANEAREGRLDAESLRRYEQERADAAKPKPLTTQEETERRHAEKEERLRIVTSSKGEDIVKADTDDDAKAANRVLLYNKQMNELAKDGIKLFKDGYAFDAGTRRGLQQAWIAQWATLRRYASGDTSAPNANDQKIWGIDDDKWIRDNPAIILDQLKTARKMGHAVLEKTRVPLEWRRKEGFIGQDEEDIPTPGHTEPVLFVDDKGVVSRDRSGSPMTPEASKEWLDKHGGFLNDEEQLRGGKPGVDRPMTGEELFKAPWD